MPRQKLPTQVTVSRDSLVRLLNYVEPNERKDFEEAHHRRARTHIFKTIKTLRDDELLDRPRKYLFVVLEVWDGERVYRCPSVHALKPEQSLKKAADWHAKSFYMGSKATREDGGYTFFGGEVFVELKEWRSITREDYEVLSLFL